MGARITCKVVVHSKHSSLPNGWSNSSLEPKYNRIARSNERGGVTNGTMSIIASTSCHGRSTSSFIN